MKGFQKGYLENVSNKSSVILQLVLNSLKVTGTFFGKIKLKWNFVSAPVDSPSDTHTGTLTLTHPNTNES